MIMDADKARAMLEAFARAQMLKLLRKQGKYQPHQGNRERARRIKRMQKEKENHDS